MKMKNLVLLLTVCCVSSRVGGNPPLAVPVNKDSIVDYNCSPGAKTITIHITLTADDGNYKYAVNANPNDYNLATSSTQADDNAKCIQGLADASAGGKTDIVLTQCDWDTPRFLYLLKDRPSKLLIYGGTAFHKYKIDCTLVGGVAYKIGESFTDQTAYPAQTPAPNLDLTMVIKLKTGQASDPIHVGEKLDVTVTDASAPKHYLRFDACQATEDPVVTPTTKITLVSHGNTTEGDIIKTVENPAAATLGTATLTMNAFRFAGSSDKVKLTCYMVACKDSTSCLLPSGSRFKRSSDNGTSHTVQATYTITTNEMTSGQDKAVISAATMTILLALSKLS